MSVMEEKKKKVMKFLAKEIPSVIPFIGNIWKDAVEEFTESQLDIAIDLMRSYQNADRKMKYNLFKTMLSQNMKLDAYFNQLLENQNDIISKLDGIEKKIEEIKNGPNLMLSIILIVVDKKDAEEIIGKYYNGCVKQVQVPSDINQIEKFSPSNNEQKLIEAGEVKTREYEETFNDIIKIPDLYYKFSVYSYHERQLPNALAYLQRVAQAYEQISQTALAFDQLIQNKKIYEQAAQAALVFERIALSSKIYEQATQAALVYERFAQSSKIYEQAAQAALIYEQFAQSSRIYEQAALVAQFHWNSAQPKALGRVQCKKKKSEDRSVDDNNDDKEK